MEGFKGIWVILEIWGAFLLFWRFLEDILVILIVLGILCFFWRFWKYFGHSRYFRSIFYNFGCFCCILVEAYTNTALK